jgi:ABC-type multidrug transport system fused ATPase/permease subunit
MSSLVPCFRSTNTHSDGTQALKTVSFTIEAGKKFGICGRTGR